MYVSEITLGRMNILYHSFFSIKCSEPSITWRCPLNHCVCCSTDGGSPVHSSRVMSSTSFCVTPHTPGSGAGVRSDLLRSVHNRATQLPTVSDTSPSRASPANSGSSPRDSQASVTSTDSSSSSRVSGTKDTGLIELSQQVSYNCYTYTHTNNNNYRQNLSGC